jgi:translation initiation factor 2B subunit (eIF-2B alpha/beta/delta family)
MQQLTEKIGELSRSIMEYDYSVLLDEIEPELRRLVSARLKGTKSFDEVYRFLGEVRKLLEELLPVAMPLAVLDSLVEALRLAESKGFDVDEAESLAQAVLTTASTYLSISLQSIVLSLSYAVRPNSSILTVGYSQFLKEVLVRLRGRVASVHTTFGRPLLSGRRMAVELLAEGINAYSWPDAYVTSLVSRADYIVLSTPGVSVNGVIALDPGAYPAISLAKLMGKPVFIVLTGLTVVDSDITRNAERRIKIDLIDKRISTTLTLAPFEYASISDADLVITEVGALKEATSEKLESLARRARSALVELALKALG